MKTVFIFCSIVITFFVIMMLTVFSITFPPFWFTCEFWAISAASFLASTLAGLLAIYIHGVDEAKKNKVENTLKVESTFPKHFNKKH